MAVLARIALLVAVGDWVTKAVALRLLAGEPIVVSQGFRFALLHNDGTAFGWSAGAYTWQLNLALTLVSILLMIPVASDLARIDKAAPRALGLILGGAVGNFASLLASPQGVVDFMSVSLGGEAALVFNLADLAAYVGLAMMLRTGFLIVTEMRRAAMPGRNSLVSHWVTQRGTVLTDREVVRPVMMADVTASDVDAELVVRPESVRRTELLDLETAMADPQVIDIRPHLALQRQEARGRRPELRGSAEERVD
jgi:lipoprotein signal peptidase